MTPASWLAWVYSLVCKHERWGVLRGDGLGNYVFIYETPNPDAPYQKTKPEMLSLELQKWS